MSVRTTEEWKRLADEAWGELIVGPERLQWILERYPPTEQGRPGIIHTTPRGEKRKRPQPDAPVELDGKPEWRQTFEFSGDESALELSEVAAD
jgi:hypothetical protein